MFDLSVYDPIYRAGVFEKGKAHFIVDGQFGSTGKGLLAGLYAEMGHNDVNWCASNAGPNSGHTSYLGDEKIVLRQLPTFGVTAYKLGSKPLVYLDGGAIIDNDILQDELGEHDMTIAVHPHAAVISQAHKFQETTLVGQIGSTGKGVGAALADKVRRTNPGFEGTLNRPLRALPLRVDVNKLCAQGQTGMVEVSQGFSLGINAGFYPHCTSRDCTMMAAMSDLGLHPRFHGTTSMVVRTYPIRVAGNSGDIYDDQHEITWEQLGEEPELTTVTKKVRRVFTWSNQQFREACAANRPDVVLLNFCNYLNLMSEVHALAEVIHVLYKEVVGYELPVLLLGYGPRSEDVKLWRK